MNEIYLTLTTGILTLSGVIVGTLLEYLRERWKFSKEQEEKKRIAIEDRNKKFLSPLLFHLNELTFWPNLDLARDSKELTRFIETLNRKCKSLEIIDELLKENLHNLPLSLYFDFLHLKGSLTVFYEMLDCFRESVAKIKMKNVDEEDFLAYAKAITDYQEMIVSASNKIGAHFLLLMKSENPEKLLTITIYDDEVQKEFSKLALNVDESFDQFSKSIK